MLCSHVPELDSRASCLGPLVCLHPAKECPGVNEMGCAGRSVSHHADRPGMTRNGDGLQASGPANIESRLAQLRPDQSCTRGEIVPLVSILILISSASSCDRTKSRRIRRRAHTMKSLLWVPVSSGRLPNWSLVLASSMSPLVLVTDVVGVYLEIVSVLRSRCLSLY